MKVSYKVLSTAALAAVVAPAVLAAPQVHAAEAVTINSVIVDVEGVQVVVSLTEYNMAYAGFDDQLYDYLNGDNENPTITGLVVDGKYVDLAAYNTEYVFNAGVVDTDVLATISEISTEGFKVFKGFNEDGTVILEDLPGTELKVIEISAVPAKTVEFGTTAEQIQEQLGAKVTATLSNDTEAELNVTWASESFLANKAGAYEFVGTVSAPEGSDIVVPEEKATVKVEVTVEAAAFAVQEVSAINETTVKVTFPEGSKVTAEALADAKIALTAGEESLTATYVANSFGNGVAQFKLNNSAKLTDAVEYAVTAEWAEITEDTFVAKVADPYVADFVFTTTGVKADKAGEKANKDIYFTAKNQYGEAIDITNSNDNGFAVSVKKGNFPVAATVSGNKITISDALLKDETVTVTLTNKVNDKVVATATAQFKASESVGSYSGVSDIKVTKGIGGSTTELSLADLKAGDSFTLKASALNEFGNATTDNLRWVSSDNSILAPTGATATQPYNDATEQEFKALKEGTVTVTAYTADGKFFKQFNVTVGKGKLASITTTNVTDITVKNKVAANSANIVVNEETTGDNAVTDFVEFKNANGTAIPVKAADVTFEVVAPTGFEATDVTVEKVVDASGYLTGVKVASDRTKLTDAEKAGNYTDGQTYTVKVKTADTKVSEQSFAVKSVIDTKVTSVETAATAEFRAGNKVQNALVFKNAQGEALNIKADDSKLSIQNATGSVLSTPVTLKTVDGKFAETTDSEVVTGLELGAAAGSTVGTYNVLVKYDIVTKYVSVKVNADAKVETISAGSNVAGIIVNDDTTAKVNEVKFFDQDGNATAVKKSAVTVEVKKAGADAALTDAAKLVTLGKSYVTEADGTKTFTTATDANDEVKFIKVNAETGLEAGTYTVTVKSNDKTATFNVEVKAARTLTSATFTAKASTLTPGATTTVVVTPKDQYGDFIEVATLAEDIKLKSSATGVATVGALQELKDSKGEKVIGYTAEVSPVAVGTTDITVDALTGLTDLTALKQTIEVKAAGDVVKAIEIDESSLEPVYNNGDKAGTAQIDVVAKDAAGKEVSIPTSDIIYSIAGAKDENGNALTLAKTGATEYTISSTNAAYNGKKITISSTGLVTAPQGVTLTVTAKAESHNNSVDTVEINFSKEPAKFVSGLVGKVGAETLAELDADSTKAGIQISIAKDADLDIKLEGKDQYAETIQLKESLATTLIANSSVLGAAATGTAGDAAEVLALTVKVEGTTTITINYGGEKVTLEVTVTPAATPEV